MNYYSTRDHQHVVSAAQAIVCGLAPDGGLFVPEALPEVSAQQLQALCGMTYQQRAVTRQVFQALNRDRMQQTADPLGNREDQREKRSKGLSCMGLVHRLVLSRMIRRSASSL